MLSVDTLVPVSYTHLLSSGHDGFMREYVDIPASQVVSVEGVPAKIAAISEFISVGVLSLIHI